MPIDKTEMEKQSSPITPTQSILLRHPKVDSPIKPHTQKTDTLGLEAGRNEVVLDLTYFSSSYKWFARLAVMLCTP